MPEQHVSAQPIAFLNARLVDPASGYDGPGALTTSGGKIVEEASAAMAPPPSRRISARLTVRAQCCRRA